MSFLTVFEDTRRWSLSVSQHVVDGGQQRRLPAAAVPASEVVEVERPRHVTAETHGANIFCLVAYHEVVIERDPLVI